MTHSPLHNNLEQNGIDRSVLSAMRKRFLAVNQGRLARVIEGFSARQQSVLSLLPLLLHVNHPALPGYVSRQTPAGLSHYQPSEQTLAEAYKISRAFSFKRLTAASQAPIHGMFLMGSLGSLAQAEHSDLDIWLCHAPTLSAAQVDELTRKCRLIEQWAAGFGCEAHFFLINPERFRQGINDTQLGPDNCGSTQHYLLLDEFYRTAIWLAGRTPLWWLVPAKQESNYRAYTHTLISKRFVRETEVLDLGDLASIPVSEYLGAGLWQLLKGLSSPYKSVLKLLLTEVYASQFPHTLPLAVRFKEAIYRNQLTLNSLDPYLMAYQLIEDYLLAHKDQARLELVRRSLYLKANKKLSQAPNNGRKSWQRQLLEQLTRHWGWPLKQLIHLDQQQHWKTPEVMREHAALVAEMLYAYRFLADFAQQHQAGSSLNQRDLSLLGRRLSAAFERKPGKVEHLALADTQNLAEPVLTLVKRAALDQPNARWALYSGALAAYQLPLATAFKHANQLLELLAWAQLNGVLTARSRLLLYPGDSDLQEPELLRLLESLSAVLAPTELSDTALLKPSVLSEVLLMVNVGCDPLRHHSQANQHLASNRTDSLKYSAFGENLVISLDQLSRNSWQELYTEHFAGPHALVNTLCQLLSRFDPALGVPHIKVVSFCRNRAAAISLRVQGLLQVLLERYKQGVLHRYLLQVAERFYLIHLAPGDVSYLALPDQSALIRYLAHINVQAAPMELDAYALSQDSLRLVLTQAQLGCVQVFYQVQQGQVQISIMDEHNTLWRHHQPFYDRASLLNPLLRFLQTVLTRLESSQSVNKDPVARLQLYEISAQAARSGALLTATPYLWQATAGLYDVQAQLEPSDSDLPHVTLYCADQIFRSQDYAGELYTVAAAYILTKRQAALRYRCYLTDLDISRLPNIVHSTAAHLYYKSQIEYALNHALQVLN